MNILGIETSCDETAISIIAASGDTEHCTYDVLGESLLSQVDIHKPYGGVYPNVAKREHARNLVPVMEEALRQANMLEEDDRTTDEATIERIKTILGREPELFTMLAAFLRSIDKPPIDAIAVTVGPGLEPALWVGINFARALHEAWHIPVVAVNHMEGHIVMAMQKSCERRDASLQENTGIQTSESSSRRWKLEAGSYPALALLVSGGHTELVLMPALMQYPLLGQTRDDAAGEAFDKCARLLGLPYPGGPEISRLAAHARQTQPPLHNPGHRKSRLTGLTMFRVSEDHDSRLPRPMIHSKDYDFSFSGLKTAVRREVENKALGDDEKAAMAREIEDAIVEVLVAKTKRAAEEYGVETIIVGGGVSANTHLRNELAKALHPLIPFFPDPALSTDNARMIALAGYLHATREEFADPESLKAQGNLKLA